MDFRGRKEIERKGGKKEIERKGGKKDREGRQEDGYGEGRRRGKEQRQGCKGHGGREM